MNELENTCVTACCGAGFMDGTDICGQCHEHTSGMCSNCGMDIGSDGGCGPCQALEVE